MVVVEGWRLAATIVVGVRWSRWWLGRLVVEGLVAEGGGVKREI